VAAAFSTTLGVLSVQAGYFCFVVYEIAGVVTTCRRLDRAALADLEHFMRAVVAGYRPAWPADRSLIRHGACCLLRRVCDAVQGLSGGGQDLAKMSSKSACQAVGPYNGGRLFSAGSPC